MRDLMRSPAMNLTKASATWIVAVVLVLAGCLGGGIDTFQRGGASVPYVISGRVERPDGSPDSGAVVSLYPSDYDAAGSSGWVVRRVIADSLGRFWFSEGRDATLFTTTASRRAYYSVVARSADGVLWRMADSLRPEGLTARVDTLRLAMPRRLVADLTAADSVMGVRFPVLLSVRGTDILVSLDGANAPIVDTLPVGARSVIVRFGTQAPITLAMPSPEPQSDPGHGEPLPDTLHVKASPNGPTIER